MKNQNFILAEAKKLAHEGKDFDHLLALFEPESFLNFKIFIQSLPKALATKSIFGRAHWKEQSLAQQKRRG
jgi:hypothetical protein